MHTISQSQNLHRPSGPELAAGGLGALIVTDARPLLALAVANALDTLLVPARTVIVPDMVRFEVIQDLDRPGAQEAADWIRSHEGEGLGLRIASTEVFEEFLTLLAARPGTATAGRSERAAAEILDKELANQDHGAILLFDDSDVRRRNYLVPLPSEVVEASTSDFRALSSAMQKNTAERAKSGI